MFYSLVLTDKLPIHVSIIVYYGDNNKVMSIIENFIIIEDGESEILIEWTITLVLDEWFNFGKVFNILKSNI